MHTYSTCKYFINTQDINVVGIHLYTYITVRTYSICMHSIYTYAHCKYNNYLLTYLLNFTSSYVPTFCLCILKFIFFTYIHTYIHLLFKHHIYVIHTYIHTKKCNNKQCYKKYNLYIHTYTYIYIHNIQTCLQSHHTMLCHTYIHTILQCWLRIILT